MNFSNCISKKTGEPLKCYGSEPEAIDAADYVLATYQRSMVPYLCHYCGAWHLCPADRHTPSRECGYCTSGDGRHKQLYDSKSAAEKRAHCLYKENGINLKVYPCPHQDGWHLTKANSWEGAYDGY